MKPVQLVIAATAALFATACGSSGAGVAGAGGTDGKCNADGTFAQVQQQIFDR